jgi:hypothetical protein
MKLIKSFLRYSCLSGMVLSVCLAGAGLAGAQDAVGPKYLKWNIHYQQHRADAKASYANWTDPGQGHVILPVNSKVEFQTFRGGFSIIALPTRQEILFAYDERNMHMTIPEYQALLASPTPVSLDAFSEVDCRGISEGKAYPGMSKTGVMTALGYPAAHRTTSPDANTWVYWKNRFKTFAIQFDDKGLVTEVGQ